MSLEEIKRSTPYPSFREVAVSPILKLSILLSTVLFGVMFFFFKHIAPPGAIATVILLIIGIGYWFSRDLLRERSINEKVRSYRLF